MNRKYFGAKESLSMATRDTKLLVGLTIGQIGKLLSGQAAPSKSLGGPVQIFRDAGAAAKAGAHTWWRMMAVLSISLAIVNFLPVPVLDGGQFLFFLVEGIRGRPVSLRFRERAQQIGVLLLVSLMLMVLVFDIGRIFGKG
jgi:regulator of sigma E protease